MLKQLCCNHKTELVYTKPMVKDLGDGRKSSKREWIDHIVCTKCGKKWFPPSDEEVKDKLKKLNLGQNGK